MSAEQQPELKRKRMAESADESSPPVQPMRSSIWYDDGNVILQAETVQFKVHKSILAQSSSVFSDMLSFPQPPTTETEMIESCPVVRLSDSAEDVEYVLQALCQRKYVTYQDNVGNKLPFGVVSAFLRLGQKYDIQPLYREAQNRLFLECPTTLAAYDAIQNWNTIIGPNFMTEIALLARKTGLLSILPHVLLQCCVLYPATEIIDGHQMPNGSAIFLPLQDQLSCLAAVKNIQDAHADTTFKWLRRLNTSLADGCGNDKLCKIARAGMSLHLFTPPVDIQGLDWDWNDECSQDLCEECATVAKKKHREGREEFWERLPGLFRLPLWKELLKEREETQ